MLLDLPHVFMWFYYYFYFIFFFLVLFFFFFFFFFSSRRRHTRSLRDWSSDVCSSDLQARRREGLHLGRQAPRRRQGGPGDRMAQGRFRARPRPCQGHRGPAQGHEVGRRLVIGRRSEERRVGKEWRSRRCADRRKREGN